MRGRRKGRSEVRIRDAHTGQPEGDGWFMFEFCCVIMRPGGAGPPRNCRGRGRGGLVKQGRPRTPHCLRRLVCFFVHRRGYGVRGSSSARRAYATCHHGRRWSSGVAGGGGPAARRGTCTPRRGWRRGRPDRFTRSSSSRNIPEWTCHAVRDTRVSLAEGTRHPRFGQRPRGRRWPAPTAVTLAPGRMRTRGCCRITRR